MSESQSVMTAEAKRVLKEYEKYPNTPIHNKYDFIILYDVENGNPNGDPDAGGIPRIDPETELGIITDVCLKRKVRNYIDTMLGGCSNDGKSYNIYVKEGVPLRRNDMEAIKYVGVDPKGLKEAKKNDPDLDRKLMNFMCDNFFDIRTFGAVMTTFVENALNCGQVRGPVQLHFGRSFDPVFTQEMLITRQAVTTEEDFQKKSHEFGRKSIVPYGLYCTKGHISAALANQITGFSERDLALFWDAIMGMFEHERSAARGMMAVRKLVIFKHHSVYGNAPAHKLFERLSVEKKPGVGVPRSYNDYNVSLDSSNLPNGVTVEVRE